MEVIKKGKTVKPALKTEENSKVQKEKKVSYEELNNYCIQLYNQNKTLIEQVKQKDMFNIFKRMDYLFQVLRYKDCFNNTFVETCAEEIQNALTVAEEATGSAFKEK